VPEGVENEAETRKAVGPAGISPQRRLNERERGMQTAALIMELAETVQDVEVVGLIMQQRVVEPLRLGELAAFVSAPRAPKHARKI